MSEFAVTGTDVKRLLKMSRSKPVQFAFRPGKAPKDHVLALHLKRSGSFMGKALKKEVAGSKVGWGTLTMTPKTLDLTCEKALPTMAKRVKQFLKLNKCSVNVQILDGSGKVIEADIEDGLEPDADMFEDTQATEQAPPAAQPAPPGASEPVAEAPKPQPEARPQSAPVDGAAAAPKADILTPTKVVEALKSLKPRLDNAPDAVAEKLKKALGQAAALVKGGDLESAQDIINRLEAAADKLESAPPSAPKTDEAAQNPKEKTRALAMRAKELQTAMSSVPADAAAGLQADLKAAVAAMKSGDFDAAEDLLTKLDGKLAALKTPTETSTEQPDAKDSPAAAAQERAQAVLRGDALARVNARFETALASGDPGKIQAAQHFAEEAVRLQKTVVALAPDFKRAMASGQVSDPKKLEQLFKSALAMSASGDHAKARQSLGDAQDIIAQSAQADAAAFLPDIDEDLQKIAISRLDWTKTQTTMSLEIGKLKDQIIAACQGQAALQPVIDNVGALAAYTDDLDLRLADALNDILKADPAQRDELKATAGDIVAEYKTTLQNPFFQDVDGNNGFTKVAVTETAQAALTGIEKALAA